MSNTKDLIGEQETLDALIADNIENLEDSDVETVGPYALAYKKTLKTINFPNAKKIGDSAFYGSSNLTEISIPSAEEVSYNMIYGTSITELDLPSLKKISSNDAFANSKTQKITCGINFSTLERRLGRGDKLHSLFLLSPVKVTCSTSYPLAMTKIAYDEGSVYVPSELVAEYKNDEKWNIYNIASIDDYPASHGTITDTWDEIIASENDGSYLTKYSLGDTKSVMIKGCPHLMQIVAFDTDETENSNETAHITWMSKYAFDYVKMKEPSNQSSVEFGWLSTDVKTYLEEDIYSNIDIKDYIVGVKKTFTVISKDTPTTQYETEKIWIPSMREMFGSESGQDKYCETEGCDYTSYFNTNDKIKFSNLGTIVSYWLRTQQNSVNMWQVVTTNGVAKLNTTYASNSGYLILGFCT